MILVQPTLRLAPGDHQHPKRSYAPLDVWFDVQGRAASHKWFEVAACTLQGPDERIEIFTEALRFKCCQSRDAIRLQVWLSPFNVSHRGGNGRCNLIRHPVEVRQEFVSASGVNLQQWNDQRPDFAVHWPSRGKAVDHRQVAFHSKKTGVHDCTDGACTTDMIGALSLLRRQPNVQRHQYSRGRSNCRRPSGSFRCPQTGYTQQQCCRRRSECEGDKGERQWPNKRESHECYLPTFSVEAILP